MDYVTKEIIGTACSPLYHIYQNSCKALFKNMAALVAARVFGGIVCVAPREWLTCRNGIAHSSR